MFITGKSLEEVKTYAGRVDAQVDSIDADVLRYAIKKWGPSGFAASYTLQQQDNFLRDKSSWEDWKRWRDLWKAKKADVDDSWYGSDDRYTEVEKFDLESKAWRKVWNDRGYYLGAPTTVEIVKDKEGNEKLSHPDVPLGTTAIDWSTVLLASVFVAGVGAGSYVYFKKKKDNRRPSMAMAELSPSAMRELAIIRSTRRS